MALLIIFIISNATGTIFLHSVQFKIILPIFHIQLLLIIKVHFKTYSKYGTIDAEIKTAAM